jgi:uncharacterized protein YukE
MATSSGMMIADPSKMQQGAQDTEICLGELETYLRTLSSVNDGMLTAVAGSKTSDAIQASIQNAGTAGTKLANTLNQIIEALKKAGVQVDDHDLSGASKVYASIGGDGKVDTNF